MDVIKKTLVIISLLLLLVLPFLSSASLSIQTQSPIWQLHSSVQESDYNGDGIADVKTEFIALNNTLMEIRVSQTNPNTKGGNAYKGSSAICDLSSSKMLTNSLKVLNEDAQGGFNNAYPINLNYGKLTNYGMPSSWCNETGGMGYVLFGAGSGNKTYRLNFPDGDKKIKILTGKATDEKFIVYQPISTIFFQANDFNVTITTKKYNGIEYIIAPSDIWVNNEEDCLAKNKTGICWGFYDYNPLNNSEGALNKYQQVFNSTKEINSMWGKYYINDGVSFYEKVGMFFGYTYQSVQYIEVGDICRNDFNSCQYDLSSDNKVLTITTNLKSIGGMVDGDPAFYNEIRSSTNSDILFTNRTEGSSTGLRLTASVLSMDFNTNGENYPNLPYQNRSLYEQGTYIKDGSVYNNFGTSSGLTKQYWWNGNTNGASVINGSLQFDGVNDYVNVSNDFNFSSSSTISFWAKPDILAQTNFAGIVSKCSAVSNNDFAIGIYATGTANNYYFRANNGTHFSSTTESSITNLFPNTNWHLITWVINGLNNSVYRNGVLIKSFTGVAVNDINRDFFIGSLCSVNNYYFNGSIDDVIIWSRELNSTEISTIYNEGVAGRTVDNSTIGNQVAHFTLDELSGTNTYNSINAGANGTLTNYPTTALTAPIYNATGGPDGSGAYVFDGIDDQITTVLPTGLTTRKGSIALWIKTNKSGSGGSNYGFPLGFSGASWGVYINRYNSGRITFFFDGSTTSAPESTTIVTDNNWHFVVGTNDGTTSRVYVDGNLEASLAETNTNPSGLLYIGSSSGTNYWFNGSLDNVQIFNQALSANEILNMYNGTNANKSLKYSTTQGDFKSLVFYNSTQTYWNITLSTADTRGRSGIVNADNSINLSNPNLVSYFPFDGSYTDIKTGNTPTCGNRTLTTTCPNNATGLSSNAMLGANDTINKPSLNLSVYPFMVGGNNFSVSLWLYTNIRMDNGNGILFSNRLSSTERFFIGHSGSSGAIWGFYGIGASLYGNSGSSTRGQWHHVVASYNGTWTNLYIDGIQGTGTTQSGSPNVPNQSAIFSNGDLVVNDLFGGYIDEVLIYNKSLSYDETIQLYKSGLSQHANTNITLQTRTANNYNISDPGLVAFWALNNDSSIGENSTYFVDLTGRNNGTGLLGVISNSSSGVVDNGAYFDGANDRINVSDSDSLDITQNVTISAWVNLRSTPASYVGIADKGTNEYVLYIVGGTTSGGCASLDVGFGKSGVITYNCSSKGITLGQWYHVSAVMDSATTSKIYINGIEVTESGSVGARSALAANTIPLVIGARWDATSPFPGLIDEIRIYNRSLSYSEIQNLYELGSYHINWNNNGDYSNESIATDNKGQYATTSAPTKFMQFKTNFYSNTTDQTPYILAYNVSYAPDPNSPPNVTWLSQIPQDISTQVIFEDPLNINYSIIDSDGISPLNYTNVTFYWKVNTTTSNMVQFYLNGSNYQSLAPGMVDSQNFFNRRSLWSNISEVWTQSVNANEFLPATYNINEFIMETTAHNIVTLTNTDDSVAIELLNINNQTQFNFFELMVNSTANAAPLEFYYCNDSYLGGKVTTSVNCHNFNTLLNTQTFNHNHSNYTQHQVISMFINTTSGSTNSLKVTARGTLVARMAGGTGDWYVYNIPNTARLSATKTSNTAGTTWTNQTYTFDAHLHQFYNDSVLNYRACASDTAYLVGCSGTNYDSLELGNLPPQAPIVFNPPAGFSQEDGSITINWTHADSPNGYNITYYNVSLYNLDFSLNFTINATVLENGASTHGLIWNGLNNLGQQVYGTYYIGVTTYDINNLSATGFSGNFSRLQDITKPYIEIQKPIQALIQDLVFPVKISATDFSGISRIWFNVDGGTNTTYTSETHATATNGYHTLWAYTNDTYNNINSTSVYFFAGNVQSNQECPIGDAYGNWSQTGSYSNGTIICSYTNFSAGPQGPEGPQGPAGPQGPQGQNGSIGLNGTNGIVPKCAYKRYGYYDLSLPWFRDENCI